MRMVDLIEKKRNGNNLSKKEIDYIISCFTTGEIPDYQMSAFLMTVFYEDMTENEITDLTLAMAYSGDIIDLSAIKGIKVDKHSTGGVGDTTTLVLAPLVASLGIPVAKMSGKGLGHTGGTIDKLEAIPGFQAELSNEQFIYLVNSYGLAVTGQSGDLAPADKKLYALRDVTATVDSIPLIASSIMSKKIASGADAIVLDVTVGDGAFMKDYASAERLAKTMVQIGNLAKKKTTAVLSNMSQPLGAAIGNSLEVVEAIHTLQGNGPEDLVELIYSLGSQMLLLANKATSAKDAREKLIESLQSGKALAKFREMIQNQGGDTSFINFPEQLLTAKYKIDLPARRSGYIQAIRADEMGIAAMLLGAGRKTKEDTIDYSVGLQLHKKVGQFVEQGEALVTVHSNQQDISSVKEKIYQNITIGDSGEEPELIYSIITNEGDSK